MEGKYLELLDDEILEFIRRTEEFYPADAVTASITQQRNYYDDLCREFDVDYPQGVSSNDSIIRIDEQPVAFRQCVPANLRSKTQILFFHGGGFVVGGLESHDSICAEICEGTGCIVRSIDYRLAPEHPHPGSFEDCLVAFKCVARECDNPIILVGDSAGGNLAAAVSHTARNESSNLINRIAGQILIYPALGGDTETGSYLEHAHAPMLTKPDVDFYHEIRAGELDIGNDVTAYPLVDTDFSNLPSTVVFSAECDPLADDGKHYCKAINDAGGNAKWFHEEGLVHGYLRARHMSQKARTSFKRIVGAINAIAEQN